MSDTYVKEFEKWLKESNEATSNEEDTEGEDYDKDDDDFDESFDDDEESIGKTLLSRDQGPTFQSFRNDSAPILVDDDDDDDRLSSLNEQFGDEPPVLEPVPKQIRGVKFPNKDASKFQQQGSMRNYSRHNQTYGRKPLLAEQKRLMKTYSNKDKTQLCPDRNFEHTSQITYSRPKDCKESDNIFDKFHSMSEQFEDAPPPLIPNPDVASLRSESNIVDDKHPCHSPNFCAMEADSTSEISGNLMGGIYNSRRLSKTSAQGDVSIECDSTCMLGASPIIVSPASVSNSEMDDSRDPGGGIGGQGDKEIETEESKKCDGAGELKVKEEGKRDLQEATSKPSSDSGVDKVTLEGNPTSEESVPTSEASECKPSHLLDSYPCSDMLQTFPVAMKTEVDSDCACSFPNEPPLLSVISPQAVPQRRSRKKRHTIDSPETFSRSGKRPRTIPSPHDNEDPISEHLPPPTLTHVSESVIANGSRGKRSQNVSQHSAKCSSCVQVKHSHGKRRRRRCNTLPFAELTEYFNYLPENLCSFVTHATQLSQLQTRMHKLLYQLFPQLHLELDSMSPESNRFQELLMELVLSLERPGQHSERDDNQPLFSVVHEKDIKGNSRECQKQSHISTLEYYPSQIAASSTCASWLPPGSHSRAVGADQQDSSADHLPSIVSFASSSDNQIFQRPGNSHLLTVQPDLESSKDNDPLCPQLSSLSLKDIEEHLKPVQVVVEREPGLLLGRFAHLICRALQLLLPDLTVSLCNELASSPHDLIVFIDNVIFTNSRQKSKQ